MARLVSVGQFSLAWFAILSVVLIIGLVGAGYWMFSGANSATGWQGPWLALCFLVALDLWLNNFIWLLEGTNQLLVNYVYRLGRAILGTSSLWYFLSAGYGLYAMALSTLVGVVFLCGFLLIARPSFVAMFFRIRPGDLGISWRHEIMPLQWRLGISQLASFATYSLFVPVTFKFAGPVAAGRMGMSWNLVEAMTSIALLWPAIIFPTMGAQAARRDWHGLDKLTLWVGVQAIVLGVLGSSTLMLIAWVMQIYGFHLSDRILPLVPLAILTFTAVPKIAQSVLVYYLRAHRKEPLVGLTAIGAPLMLCAAVTGAYLGGALGVAGAYCAVMVLLMLPGTIWITMRSRALWHSQPANAQAT
jgi:hypothetical protein